MPRSDEQARAAWQDEVRWALDWVLSLATPARPDPSAWADVAWCNYWREQRGRVADALQQAVLLRDEKARLQREIARLIKEWESSAAAAYAMRTTTRLNRDDQITLIEQERTELQHVAQLAALTETDDAEKP